MIDRNNFLADRFADVLAERAIKAIVCELFEHVSAPAGAARDGEDGREKIGRNA